MASRSLARNVALCYKRTKTLQSPLQLWQTRTVYCLTRKRPIICLLSTQRFSTMNRHVIEQSSDSAAYEKRIFSAIEWSKKSKLINEALDKKIALSPATREFSIFSCISANNWDLASTLVKKLSVAGTPPLAKESNRYCAEFRVCSSNRIAVEMFSFLNILREVTIPDNGINNSYNSNETKHSTYQWSPNIETLGYMISAFRYNRWETCVECMFYFFF